MGIITFVLFLMSRILLAEVSGSLNSTMLYYGNDTYTLAELPFNNQLTQINDQSSPIELKETIEMWSKNGPENAWPTWLVRIFSQSLKL